MRIIRIIAFLLIGVLLILGACASPAPTPPRPAATPPTPEEPNMPMPAPTIPPPEPTTPPPAPAPTPPTPTPAPPTPPAQIPVQGPNEVWVPGREFRPSTLIVAVGTKVTWISKDGEQHDVTSDPRLFAGILMPGGSFSYTFTERGTFSYLCESHPEMAGTVIVR